MDSTDNVYIFLETCRTDLSSPESHIRLQAALLLRASGKQAKKVLSELISALYDEDADISFAAAEAISVIGEDAVQPLIVAMRSDAPIVREHAASALRGIGPPAGPAVESLIRLLQDAVADVRREAARALGDIRCEPEEAVPALITALQDRNLEVRAAATIALAQFGSVAKAAIPLPQGTVERI